ncbi:LLM class F420-dependent oxidoreductase [Nonomuraea ferruginea]
MTLGYSGGFKETVGELADYEKAGLDIVFVAEAYSFDAVSQMGYIAAVTERLQIASGILPIYSRTPALMAMTAAGLDYISDGRFTLGLGSSGPQVIEGFHGVPYTAPIGRTREVIEICRKVWRRERLQYDGRHYTLPLPPDQGTGLGKPLKIINHPVRSRIPIVLAAIGPKNVELAAELAEGWEPIFYVPEKAADVWGAALAARQGQTRPRAGRAGRGRPGVPLHRRRRRRPAGPRLEPMAALYIGGMGAKGKNFYNNLARRYGYEKEAEQIQELYLDGKKDEAAALVPRELLEKMSLIGDEAYVRDRMRAMKESGVTTLNVTPLGRTHEERVRLIETIKDIAS